MTINTFTASANVPAIVNINSAGNTLAEMVIDESLPLNQRIVQCAEVFTTAKSVEKYASEYIISALAVSTTEELMQKLYELQLWPADWKMPRSVYNAVEKGTPAYVIKDNGFVQYNKSTTLVLYSFIIAFARVYNLLEKRQCKAMQALQALIKDADIALSALKDAQSEDDISSRLDYAEKCIDVLPQEKQSFYVNHIYCTIDEKKNIFFPVIEKPKTIGGLQYSSVLDYDACFFDAMLFSYIPDVYDEYMSDRDIDMDYHCSPEYMQGFDKYAGYILEKLQRERKELQEKAERIAKERIAKEGIANALLLQKYAKALKDISTAVNKLSVDISKAKRADCNIALNAIRDALKEAVL